ncbi:hypothetical protein [Dermatobacter hominis]|uniref:hypothetical protein n=1 Tax=Dermatobacter hominis TaxID=2884263 RepID=UPI001D11D4C3|nr:hypothetical protein [Dermatobacter hominis]UDY37130.1 hypothetical protein LH044_06225 [Dermatobacter hominis]
MAGGADLAFGLASSVGPVPFSSAADAVDFALRTNPRFPTVPVTSDPDASLLSQSVHGLAGASVVDEALVATGPLGDVDAATAAGRLLDDPAFEAVHATAVALADPDLAAPSAVRVPVLGPVTLARALRSAGHPPASADRVAAAIVAERSVALLQAVRSAGGRRGAGDGGGPVVAVVLCEPGLVGSMHPTFPLLPVEIRDLLDPVVDALDGAAPADSLLIGVHVPGPCDWPTVIGSGASLLCVPVDRSLLGWSPLFGDLLERGGRLCWGAVPVDRPMGASTDPHWRRLVGLWTSMVADGVDPMLLRLRSSFSPADGLGHFGPSQAELVMELTVGVAERVGHQAVAARLSLGA